MQQAKKILFNLDMVLACIFLIILIIVAAATVVSRYIVGSPFMWSEEVQTACFMWITFLGAGAAFRYGAHVSIDMLVDLLPLGTRRYVELVMNLLVTLLLCYVLYLSVIYVGQIHMLKKVTTILKIPEYLINCALPIGCVFMICGNTAATLRRFVADGAKAEGEAE